MLLVLTTPTNPGKADWLPVSEIGFQGPQGPQGVPGPQGPIGPQGPSGVAGYLRTNVVPIGVVDGVNTVFTTPTKFRHDGFSNEMVYLRGLRLFEGLDSDYIAVESGGPGTGFNTLIFSSAPFPGDAMLVDYYPV